jgi:ParB-like chromosome segregation protein Spo0J
MTREVTLASLRNEHPNWLNPRLFTGLDEDKIDELAADIKINGVIIPPVVQKIRGAKEGEVINLVIDGQRRNISANRALGKDAKILVQDLSEDVVELTPDKANELMLKALSIGSKREGLCSFELSSVAERLRNGGKSLKQIGDAINKSESWVSKMLKARATATPALLTQWRKGEITDEQFKDLAAVKDTTEQEKHAAEVVQTRKSGDKAEARTRAKEIKQQAAPPKKPAPPEPKKGDKAAPLLNGKSTHKPAVAGPQEDMFKSTPAASAPPPKKVLGATRVAMEALLDMAEKRPPTSDYVKGLMDGVRYALDEGAIDSWAKAWLQYVSRVGGGGKKSKSKPKAKKLRPAVAAIPKVEAKSKTKKPARKAGKKASKR